LTLLGAGPPSQTSKRLHFAAKREPDLTQRLSSVIDTYKTQFRQQSVGTITRESCAAL
jgi:hypothetical protein